MPWLTSAWEKALLLTGRNIRSSQAYSSSCIWALNLNELLVASCRGCSLVEQ